MVEYAQMSMRDECERTRTNCHDFASNQLRALLAAQAYVPIKRMRALALQGTELANAQIDTLRISLLKLAAVVTRSTRRIRLYFASNWHGAHARFLPGSTSYSAWPAR